jgi:hypothetical protein
MVSLDLRASGNTNARFEESGGWLHIDHYIIFTYVRTISFERSCRDRRGKSENSGNDYCEHIDLVFLKAGVPFLFAFISGCGY